MAFCAASLVYSNSWLAQTTVSSGTNSSTGQGVMNVTQSDPITLSTTITNGGATLTGYNVYLVIEQLV